jgi:hypothetical protein
MTPLATDAFSSVAQGREGSGEAQVFNSGNFDPVSFMARRAELGRLESVRAQEEKTC